MIMKNTKKGILNKPKYINLLRIIDSYDEGLEFRHLAYAIFGEKEILKEKYLSPDTAKKVKIYLRDHKTKDYELLDVGEKNKIKNVIRLSEYLSTLIEFELIVKDGNKYLTKTDNKKSTFTIKGYECKLLKTNARGEMPRITVDRWKDCCIAVICLDEPEIE
jgi:hypothetical protein